jgi:hypothetical protein
MTSANVEEPGSMAKAAFDIGETIANRKVAHGCYAHFSLSRSMITPFLMKMTCLLCGKPLYPRGAIKEWIKRKTINGE